jgi:hypothetical protein
MGLLLTSVMNKLNRWHWPGPRQLRSLPLTVFSSTLGIPSLFEELSGTASRSNRGLLDAFAYAPEGDALAYGPRKRDRAAMITKAMAPRPVANWSGLYGGVNLGWGFGTSGWIDAFGDVAGIPGSSWACGQMVSSAVCKLA